MMRKMPLGSPRRRVLGAAFVAMVLAALLAARPAGAQEATADPWVFDPATPTVLRLEGDVVAGAAAAFEAALAAHPGITTLVLRGDGTILADSLAIAKRVRELRLATRIEEDAYCYVACGLIFVAGIERQAEGILCVAVLYSDTLDLTKSQLELADFIEFVLSLGLNPDLETSIIETAAGGRYCFSRHEIARFGIDVPVANPPDGWNAIPYAVLYEQPAEDSPKEASWPSFTAMAHWTLADAEGGPEIRLTAEVPEAGVTVAMTVTADPAGTEGRGLNFSFEVAVPPDFHGGSVNEIVALLAREFEATAGIGGFPGGGVGKFQFHIGGGVLDWQFLEVHFSRRWLSFVLGYETGGIAELLIEMGDEGRAAIDAAYAAWNAEAPPKQPKPA